MGKFLTILKTEMKRALKSIPYFLTGAVVLAVLAGTIAFSANKMLYGSRAVGNIQVGVAIPEEDRGAKWMMSMVSSLDSVSSLCEFVYLDEEEGRRQMKQGEIYALMLIPDQLLKGIMNGTNEPVTIVFPERAGLEAAVFRELTDAGTEILKTAQAAIYGTDELLKDMGKAAQISRAESDLNRLYLEYALSRSVYFKTEQVSASGDVTTEVFFGISCAVLAVFLLGIPAAGFLQPFSPVLEKKLYLSGFSRPMRLWARTIVLAILFALATAAPFFVCLYRGLFQSGLFSIPVWLLICICASGWVILIYEAGKGTLAGVSILFLSSIIMMFMAGGLIPSVFLPEAVAGAGRVTPVFFLMEAVKWMILEDGSGGTGQLASWIPVFRLLIMEAAFFGLAVSVRRDYE